MADIVAANVTYTIHKTSTCGRHGKHVTATVTFGDGSLTYNANTHIPLTKAKLGCPTTILQCPPGITDSGYAVTFNATLEALKLWYSNTYAAANVPAANGALIGVPEDAAIAASNVRLDFYGY